MNRRNIYKAETSPQTPALGGPPSAVTGWVEAILLFGLIPAEGAYLLDLNWKLTLAYSH